MRQAQPESNSDSMARRNSQRRTLVIGAGLAVAALVAATVLHEPAQHAQTGTDLAASSAVTSPSAPAQNGAATAGTRRGPFFDPALWGGGVRRAGALAWGCPGTPAARCQRQFALGVGPQRQ